MDEAPATLEQPCEGISRPLRVLVGCESSGRVRDAFRALGHDAVSCDIQPSERPGPHIQGNLICHEVIKQHWDLGIFFPDCTFLTVSANRWANEEWRMEARHWALAFVKTIWALPIKRISLENPIGVLPSMWKRPTQIVHPWQFGHGEVKSTCLWLKNLPALTPTNIVEGREARVWKETPGPRRKRNRSITYQGVADAMADQWGGSSVRNGNHAMNGHRVEAESQQSVQQSFSEGVGKRKD